MMIYHFVIVTNLHLAFSLSAMFIHPQIPQSFNLILTPSHSLDDKAHPKKPSPADALEKKGSGGID